MTVRQITEIGIGTYNCTYREALSRRGAEVDAFWQSYGRPAGGQAEAARVLIYRARNVLGARLDIHWRGLNPDDIPPIRWDVTDALRALACGSTLR